MIEKKQSTEKLEIGSDRSSWSCIRSGLMTTLIIVLTLILIFSIAFSVYIYYCTIPNRNDLFIPANMTISREKIQIPAIIHQTYKTKEIDKPSWNASRQRCLDIHLKLGWEYKLWTDDEAESFIKENYPDHFENYMAYPYGIQRIDALRYFILYHFGGAYLDLDVSCAKPMDPLRQFGIVFPKTDPVGLSNDFMMSAPKHPFMKLLIDSLPKWNHHFGTKYPTVMASTGPVFVSYYFGSTPTEEALALNMSVLPTYLYGNEKESYFRHVHGSSWHSSDATFILYLWENLRYVVFFSIILLCCCCTLARSRILSIASAITGKDFKRSHSKSV